MRDCLCAVNAVSTGRVTCDAEAKRNLGEIERRIRRTVDTGRLEVTSLTGIVHYARRPRVGTERLPTDLCVVRCGP
jgi:hypothetical protein